MSDTIKQMAKEREALDKANLPYNAFMRGATAGAAAVGAFNTWMPDMFTVSLWPTWVRIIVGMGFFALCINYIIRQFGFMTALRISKSC